MSAQSQITITSFIPQVTTRDLTCASPSAPADHNGWFAGGGVEVLLSKNFFLGIEYKHVALDTERHCAGPPVGTCLGAGGAFVDRDISADADIVTARLSLKWGREDRVVPLK